MSIASSSIQFSQLRERYNLQELGLNQQISDKDIQKFSSSHGSKWKLMPTHLGLKSIVADDIDHTPKSGEEKRHTFFSKWKQVKGSFATYKALIIALLEVDCGEDAESVCRLVPQNSGFSQLTDPALLPVPSPAAPSAPLNQTTPLNSGASAVQNVPTVGPKLDSTVQRDLRHILHLNWKKIRVHM